MTYITKPKLHHPTLPKNALCHTRREIQKFRHSGERRNPVTLLIGKLAESNMMTSTTEPSP